MTTQALLSAAPMWNGMISVLGDTSALTAAAGVGRQALWSAVSGGGSYASSLTYRSDFPPPPTPLGESPSGTRSSFASPGASAPVPGAPVLTLWQIGLLLAQIAIFAYLGKNIWKFIRLFRPYLARVAVRWLGTDPTAPPLLPPEARAQLVTGGFDLLVSWNLESFDF